MLVLRMLSKYVGEEKFLKGVSIYLKNHLYGNSVTNDLWKGIGEATGQFPFVVALLSGLEVSARAYKGGLLERRTTTDVCAYLSNKALAVTVAQGIPPVTIGIISGSPLAMCLLQVISHNFSRLSLSLSGLLMVPVKHCLHSRHCRRRAIRCNG